MYNYISDSNEETVRKWRYDAMLFISKNAETDYEIMTAKKLTDMMNNGKIQLDDISKRYIKLDYPVNKEGNFYGYFDPWSIMKKNIFYVLLLLSLSFTVDARTIQETECLDDLGRLAGEYYMHFQTVPDSLSEMKSFNLFKDTSAIRRIEFYEETFSIKFENISSNEIKISLENNHNVYSLLYSVDVYQKFSFFKNQMLVKTYQRDSKGNILEKENNIEIKPLIEVPGDAEYETCEKQVI